MDDGRVMEMSDAELEALLDGLEPVPRRRGDPPLTVH